MFCVGLIVYFFFVCNGCGFGKKVGIVGFGGIGYLGFLFVKVFGVEVWVIFCMYSKEVDVKVMGVDGFLVMLDRDWNVFYKMIFDFIINMVNLFEGFDLDVYLSLLDVYVKWVSVGLLEDDGIKVWN